MDVVNKIKELKNYDEIRAPRVPAEDVIIEAA